MNKAKISSVGQMSFPQALLENGLNINALRTNLLRKDEWEMLDEAVVRIARQRLNGIADLQAGGLTHNLGGLGTLISQYEKISDMSDADVSMAGVTGGREDTPDFTLVGVPVPIVHKDFRINVRRLEASRKLGETIDTYAAETAARLVRDQLETILFNGSSVVVSGDAIYGYTTFPDRGTHTGADWGTIGNIFTDVNDAIAVAEGDNFFGPFTLYVASAQYAEMRAIYTDGSGQSARDRVLALDEIEAVKPADVLADGTAVLVQMTSDVVDLAVGQDIATVQWESQGGMELHFKVMAAMAPRIKSDDNANAGVVHISGI